MGGRIITMVFNRTIDDLAAGNRHQRACFGGDSDAPKANIFDSSRIARDNHIITDQEGFFEHDDEGPQEVRQGLLCGQGKG